MEWIVTTGKTVAEAVEAALDQLGVEEADMEYEVVDQPKRGLLSRLSGSSSARIRARVKPLSREKPDRRRRSGGRDRDRPRGGGAGAGAEGTERAPRSRGGDRPSGRGGSDRQDPERRSGERPTGDRKGGGRGDRAGDTGDAPGREAAGDAQGRRSPADREDSPERDGSPSRSASSRNRRRRSPSRGPSDSPRDSSSAAGAAKVGSGPSPQADEEEVVSGTEVSLEEQAELAESFTRGLVERFGMPATVSVRVDGDDDVTVDVTGDDLGLLIGPKAATVDAIQEIVRTAVQRRIGGFGARIHVDVAGYRAKRQVALAEFARQAAQRALESGRDQVFEPMSPGDRKIVHDIVHDIVGVGTVSEGEEPRRRVVIRAVASS